jgi:hypothetical protein
LTITPLFFFQCFLIIIVITCFLLLLYSEIARRFPTLQLLDGEQVRAVHTFIAPTQSSDVKLPPIKDNCLDPSSQAVIGTFFGK